MHISYKINKLYLLIFLNIMLTCYSFSNKDPELILYNGNVAIITSVYGNREKSLKNIIPQNYPTDYYAFVADSNITNNGNWIIDSKKYQFDSSTKSLVDNNNMKNSVLKNQHPYNQYKYYKMQFYRIPKLRKYKYIIWLDSSFEIISNKLVSILIDTINKKNSPILFIRHPKRKTMYQEWKACKKDPRWNNKTLWGIKQPFQNITNQILFYKKSGYNIKKKGLWVTGFFLINMEHPKSLKFLDLWYIQNLKYSTHCQLSLPYVAWKTGINIRTICINVYKNNYIRFKGHDN